MSLLVELECGCLMGDNSLIACVGSGFLQFGDQNIPTKEQKELHERCMRDYEGQNDPKVIE